jgi:sec-independent protein translocase protein TatC
MIAFPVIANQLWKFVAPGLYRQEKRALLPFLLATPVLFAVGACFAYFITIPIALKFLLGFQGNVGGVTQEALPSVGNYLSFTMQFIMAFGIAFLLPILLMLLERSGIVTRDQLVSARRYMIVAAFAIAAVFTPPDILSQLLLAIPLVLLYELSLFAIWFTQRRRKKGAEAAPVEEV